MSANNTVSSRRTDDEGSGTTTSAPSASGTDASTSKDSMTSTTAITTSLDFDNVVIPYGFNEMECGYCKGKRAPLVSKTPKDCSKSYGVLTQSISISVYEDFLYRGWRRSGTHLYKPSNFESCCPTLTIRLAADQFCPTKSQAKILRKFRQLLHPPSSGRGLDNGHGHTSTNAAAAATTTTTTSKSNNAGADFESFLREKTRILAMLEAMTRKALEESKSVQDECKGTTPSTITYKIRPPSKAQEKRQSLLLSTTICAEIAGRHKLSPMKKEKLLQECIENLKTQNLQQQQQQQQQQSQSRTEEGKNKHDKNCTIVSIVPHLKSGRVNIILQLSHDSWEEARHYNDAMSMSIDCDDEQNRVGKDSKDKLADWYMSITGKVLESDQRKLRIETLPAYQSVLNPQVHQLYVEYQHVVHQDPNPYHTDDDNRATPSKSQSEHNDEIGDPIETLGTMDWGTHCPSTFRKEVIAMLTAYLAPHPTHVQRALLSNFFSFYQFLVESPLKNKSRAEVGGTFHQQYWIGDVLIAVGVVDILPQGLSSVYLYYHPGMSHSLVALGKLAILKEIEYTRDVLKKPWYYLGYYIESCRKMRYKGEYHPSEILCPVYYKWCPYPEAVPKLQATAHNVCALVEGEDKKDTNMSDAVLAKVPIYIGADMVISMDMLQDNGKDMVRPILVDFVSEIGLEIAQKCMLKLT